MLTLMKEKLIGAPGVFRPPRGIKGRACVQKYGALVNPAPGEPGPSNKAWAQGQELDNFTLGNFTLRLTPTFKPSP